jgi:hypothetical protein
MSGVVMVKVGVYCLRGGGHFDTYDEEEGGMCGMKGPDVFVAYDPDEFPLDAYPDWLQELILSSSAASREQDGQTR